MTKACSAENGGKSTPLIAQLQNDPTIDPMADKDLNHSERLINHARRNLPYYSQMNINHWLCVTLESRQNFHKAPYASPSKDMHLKKSPNNKLKSVFVCNGCEELYFPIRKPKE